MSKEREVKLRNLIAYGMGDFYGGGSFLIIGMLFMFFLTEVVGLSPIYASLVFAVGKVWDAISDPLMGYISDHTHTRVGRRRVYLLIGIVPIFITFVLMWLPVSFSSQVLVFIYYSVAYLLFSTVFTMVMVPYSAINAEMTTDYAVRTRLSGTRIIFSQISALFAGTLPKIIINQFTSPLNKIILPLNELKTSLSGGETADVSLKLQQLVKVLGESPLLNFKGFIANIVPQNYTAFVQKLPELTSSVTSYQAKIGVGSGDTTAINDLYAYLGTVTPELNAVIKSANQTGYIVMAVVFGILYAIPWLFVFLGTWELPYERKKRDGSGALEVFRNFGTIFRNKSFRVHIAMYICAYTAMDITMALFMYYLKFNLQHDNWYPFAMGSLLVTQILMLPVYVLISNKKGKGFAYKMGLSIWAVGMFVSYFLNPDAQVIQLVLNCVLIGAGLSAGVMIPWAILPSITDVDEMITTKKRAGVYSGAMTLIRKGVQGVLAMPIIGVTLQLIGFVQGQTSQSADTLFKLKNFFIWGPTIFLIFGVAVAFLFKITPHTHNVLSNELKRRREGEDGNDVDDYTRQVLEELTGMEYDKLYQ